MSCGNCPYFSPDDDCWLYGECRKFDHAVMSDDPDCSDWDETEMEDGDE